MDFLTIYHIDKAGKALLRLQIQDNQGRLGIWQKRVNTLGQGELGWGGVGCGGVGRGVREWRALSTQDHQYQLCVGWD